MSESEVRESATAEHPRAAKDYEVGLALPHDVLWSPEARLAARAALSRPASDRRPASSDGSPEHSAHEIVPQDLPAADFRRRLRAACPLVVELETQEGPQLLAIARCSRRWVDLARAEEPPRTARTSRDTVQTSRRTSRFVRVSLDALENVLWQSALNHPEMASWVSAADDLLSAGGSLQPHRGRQRRADVSSKRVRTWLIPAMRGRPLATGESLRPVQTQLGAALRRSRFWLRSAAVIVAFVVQTFFFVHVWTFAGQALVADTKASASGLTLALPLSLRLGAWSLAHILTSAALGSLTVEFGSVLRAWLLQRMLRLDPQRLRRAGLGDLLGRVLEAESWDGLAMGGGIQVVAGAFELVSGVVVMLLSNASRAPVIVALLTLGFGAIWWRRYLRCFQDWANARRALSGDAIERMAGQTTTLVQEDPGARAIADAHGLASYEVAARRLDRAEARVGILWPRAFLLVALLTTLVPTMFGAASVKTFVATSLPTLLGGVWLFHSGLRRWGESAPLWAAVRDSWQRMSTLLNNKSSAVPAGSSNVVDSSTTTNALAEGAAQAEGVAQIELSDVSYQYEGGIAPVFASANIAIPKGARVLILGPSGGGKSTLVGLLTGLKTPLRGEVRLNARSQRAMGLSEWRGRVGAVPQFHDNHVLSAALNFNLLMGRRWPPRHEDMRAAAEVCERLGLGPLLARMPAGLQQQVGETGWQLSHGEQSRVFLARSLLQTLDVRVLDETFAALDSDTLDEVLQVVLARPETLIVVAHP